MVIYDTATKSFRTWQQGDRPQCSACQIIDLSYLVRVCPHRWQPAQVSLGSAHLVRNSLLSEPPGGKFCAVQHQNPTVSWQPPPARQVKFHEVPTQLLHSVHADSACTVCGKHFIVQSELLAMCPSRSAAPSPANAAPSSSSKLPAVDKPLIEYSIEEVCSWVEALQMDSTLWRENTITGRDLKHLSDEELKVNTRLHVSPAVCYRFMQVLGHLRTQACC